MALLLPAFGLFLLAIGASSGFFVALLRSLPPKRIGVDLLGIAVGGAIGVLPGGAMAFLAVMNGVIGPVASVPSWSLAMITVAAGGAVGVCVGLGLADRLLGLRGMPVALAAAVGGLATGFLLAGVGLVLTQQTPLESAALVLVPLTVIGTTLAGYAAKASI